jgi:hypothetical protein
VQDLFRHLNIHARVSYMKQKIKKVANKLEKASKAHAGQAKTLKSLLKNGKKKNKRS